MKKLVFVIQLIFLYSGLAMADPVISLKTLLHEMTDRSALARWPENTYTCKQFSSYDRSSHNMTDKRAWFGNFDQGQFIRQEENGGRTEYVMMDAEGPGAIVRFWMTFSGINRGQGTLRIYLFIVQIINRRERYILLLKPMYYYTLKIKKKEIPERSSPSSYLLKIILHIPDINDWA